MDLTLLPRSRRRARQDMVDRRYPGHAGGWKHRPRNRHPTVKPVGVMRWLVRLVTPPGGLVLDCFGGSGTLGIAADLEGLDAILIERDLESVITSRARIALWHRHGERAPDTIPTIPQPTPHAELPPATLQEAYLRARRTMTRTPAAALTEARKMMAAPARPRNDRDQLAMELF